MSKGHKVRSLLTGAALSVLAANSAQAALVTADLVVSYTSGAVPNTFEGDPYDISGASLGLPAADTGYGVLTPFNGAFARDQITGVGAGGNLILHLSSPVSTAGKTLGVHAAVGLIDADYPYGQNLSTATPYTDPRVASVSVSHNGTTWVSLGMVEFDIPTNYYTQGITSPGFQETQGTMVADFAKPFTGSLSDFDGENWAATLATLDGSAGGEWLDLSGTGLQEVNYVKFEVAEPGAKLFVDSVVGVAVPEPTGLIVLLPAAALLRRRRD